MKEDEDILEDEELEDEALDDEEEEDDEEVTDALKVGVSDDSQVKGDGLA